MTRVASIVHQESLLSSEEKAGREWLMKQRGVKAETIALQALSAKSTELRHFDIVWWHYDSALDLPEISRDPQITAAFSGFVRRGGSAFLSLLAAQYVVDLGLEQNKPNYLRKGTWEHESWVKDYPDIRGLGSNQGHPIFKDLSGAVYTWNPRKGTPYAAAFYDAPEVPRQGKIVAVERQYIKLNEDWRLVTEYDHGKGKVLAIGSHLFFSDSKDRFRPHLETFTLNCLEYLGHPAKGAVAKTYWSFEPRTVREERRTSQPLQPGSQSLPVEQSGLMIVREPEQVSDSFFDVGGRRILMMGREQEGLREVWCHPFRMLRNLRTGFRIGSGQLQWFDALKPRVTVRPESVTRAYAVGEMRVEEMIVGDVSQPAGCIHYHINTNHPIELLVTATVDQRLMWPHSENATGSLVYAWDQGLRAFLVRNDSGRLVSIIGTSLMPAETLAGQLKDITLRKDRLHGTTNEGIEVALSFRYELHQPQVDFSILLAGSDRGEQEALRAYRALSAHPATALQKQVRHFQSLFKNSTMIDSPDPVFNEGYRWALVGTDRFLVETPSLGTSLMAGFGTTERGWDGGQKISGRPGYAWYFGRDACWTAFAMLDYGDVEGVREVLSFLGRHQDLSGKILHELTTSGHAHYDSADSTPLYCILMGRYARTSGDVEFIRKEYHRLLKAMEFCSSTDTDKDHLIENTNVGHGWVEGGKLFPVHTELYLAACWVSALEEAAFVAQTLKKPEDARKWESEAGRARQALQSFWNGETRFYNFAKYADGSFNQEKTILPAVAIYFGCTEPGKAEHTLREYASSDFTADWGVRIVGKSNPFFNPQGYHQGSVWPLFTGWAALAEIRSGRELQGYLHAVSTMFGYQQGAAGYVEEVLHGERFQPAGVCSHQAWSQSMILQPLLEGMVGVRFESTKNEFSLKPWAPPHWKDVSITNIRAGKTRLHLRMTRAKQSMVVTIKSKDKKPVDVLVFLPRWHGMKMTDIRITPSDTARTKGSSLSEGILALRIRGNVEIAAKFVNGLALVPPVLQLKPGEVSSGLRILSERFVGQRYEIELEGVSGREYGLSVIDGGELVRSVENAVLERREGEMVHLRVSLPSGGTSGYRRAVIALLTS